MYVYLNGKVLPDEEARISPHDRGFLLGDGLFETLRFYRGMPFRLEAHVERLRRGARFLGIPLSPSTGQISRAMKELIQRNDLLEGVARITLSRGEGERGLGISGRERPTLLISTFPLKTLPSHWYAEGVKGVPVEWPGKRKDALGWVKATSYLRGIAAFQKAAAEGGTEAIYLDEGWVVEGAGSNIFGLWGDRLKTPPIKSGILPGITRGIVLQIGRKMGLDVGEEDFTLPELLEGDESWMTNSVVEILPMTRIGSSRIGGGRAGPVWRKIFETYEEWVAKEVGKPVKE